MTRVYFIFNNPELKKFDYVCWISMVLDWEPEKIWTCVFWMPVRCSYKNWATGALVLEQRIDGNIHRHSSILRLDLLVEYWHTFCCSLTELGINSHFACTVRIPPGADWKHFSFWKKKLWHLSCHSCSATAPVAQFKSWLFFSLSFWICPQWIPISLHNHYLIMNK